MTCPEQGFGVWDRAGESKVQGPRSKVQESKVQPAWGRTESAAPGAAGT
jgi:hypothetical protein